jgi:cytochrome c biogenesis protein CcdA
VFFGLSMGYVGAYAFGKSEPGPKDSAGTGAFVVYYPPLSQALSWLLAAVFASMGVSLGLGMIGMSAFTTFSPLPSAVMILLCVKLVIAAISAALFRARVDSQVLNLQSMFRKQRIGRDRVQSVQAMGLGFRLLWPTAFGETYRIIWRDESGISRRTHVSISQDMVHGDRLVAWLELSVAAREANKA